MRVLKRLGRALFNIVFPLLIIFVRGCVARPATYFSGDHFNQGKNAAWIGIEWVNEPHTDAEIASLASDLKQRQIKYAFVYVSYLHQDGQFGATYAHAAEFINTFKKTAPDIKLLAWIGLPLTYVNLSDAQVRSTITSFAANLVNPPGFDGIHYDPEPLNEGDGSILKLLDETRQAVQPTTILSIATSKMWPVIPETLAHQIGPIMWSADYYRELAHHVDQIAVMTYDSGITSPVLYRQWSHFQVIQISKALAGSGVELLFGVPTSEEATSTHDPAAENISSGLQGVIDGLNDLETKPEAVTGVAIYNYWETDPSEWGLYDRMWLGK